MNIIKSYQLNDVDEISWKVDKEKITITLNNKKEIFDFTGLPFGSVDKIEVEVLDYCPIVSAKKDEKGIELEIICFYKTSEKENFEIETPEKESSMIGGVINGKNNMVK